MCRNTASLRRSGFRAALETEEHLARHDEGSRFEDTHEKRRTDGARKTGAVTRHEPRLPAADRIKTKLPHPLESLALTAQNEGLERLKGPHWKAGATTHRYDVTDRESLELRKDSLRARGIKKTEHAVEAVIAIQPAASKPHLDEPGPDISDRRVNRDGESRFIGCVRDLRVSEHRPLDLRVGR